MFVGAGSLQKYLDDPDVLEVMVVSGTSVWVETRDGMTRRDALAPHEFGVIVERLLRSTGRRIDMASPSVESRLSDGSRLSVVIPPIAVDGGAMCIRKFSPTRLSLSDFCDDDVASVVTSLVAERKNIVVTGATSSGKTSMLMAMSSLVDSRDRIVTIEDTTELHFSLPHVVRLQSRPPSIEGVGAVSMEHLVRTALRLRPDRIIVGEVRGGEVVDMLMALSTGHRGSWTTCHANSASEVSTRIASLLTRAAPSWNAAAIDDLICGALDAVIHLAPPPLRRIESIRTLGGDELC